MKLELTKIAFLLIFLGKPIRPIKFVCMRPISFLLQGFLQIMTEVRKKVVLLVIVKHMPHYIIYFYSLL